MLAILATALALSVSAPAQPADVVARVIGVPTTCYETLGAWNVADSGDPAQLWWLGIAAFYDAREPHIGLTPNVCTALTRLEKGPLTMTQAIAAFTVAHEWGHVVGGQDETAADCYGARHAAAIAYTFGLRGRQSFLELREFVAHYAGYQRIPAACFTA